MNMRDRHNPDPEANVYADVYKVLLGGMVVSTLLFIFGLLRAMATHTYFPLNEGWVKQHYHWGVFVQGLKALDPTTLLMLATILLILTPVARVVVSIYAFWVDGDRKYVMVTSIVLLIMVATYVASRLGLQ